MSRDIGIVLVHGYLGAPADLAALAQALARRHGADAVTCLCLPGHGDGGTPAFAEAAFLAELAAAIDSQRARGRDLVLIGHSTGGSLILGELARRRATDPASLDAWRLLVLAATPPRIDLAYAQRWSVHGQGRAIGLDDLGACVALVNRLARRAPLALPAPVLILHGEADELVPVADALLWRHGRLSGAQRHVHIPGAGHHLFAGEGSGMAIDSLCRAVDDARRRDSEPVPRALFDQVPGLEAFSAAWPDSARHLAASPSGMEAAERTFVPEARATVEPTLANIEITTRCTLGCPACARTQRKLQSRFMSRADFGRVLAQLPHAWRVNLVGLGEPLLHPEVIDFIGLAVAAGRRTSLVTNAMNLDAEMARALCASGLASLTFSLDAVDPATAARVRTGSDMALISSHIRGLIAERRRQGTKLGTAAFTALSVDNLDEFEAIIDFAADHELDALMVTDLNFPTNQPRSVHQAYTPAQARDISARLRSALKRAVARRLPVLSVWCLEQLALDARYLDYLLLRGEQLALRSVRRTHCLSPWQTVAVAVDGDLSLCDCQPDAVIGNLHNTPLADWWHGPAMLEQRRRMLGDNPPEACRVCPRF